MATIVGTREARPVLEAWMNHADTLIDAARAHPEAEALRGRGEVLVVPTGSGARWVVRHYRRGGAVASFLGDRYLRTPSPRPIREYRLLRALERLGVPVPRPIGAAVYPAGLFYRGDLVTEWVAGSMDLAAVLFGAAQLDELEPKAAVDPTGSGGRSDRREAPNAEAAMEAAGRLTRLLHERGVDHPDLNIKNVLIVPGTEEPRALVLDLDRARIRGGGLREGARRPMLERFRRSLAKWQNRAGGAAPRPGLMEAFDRGYRTGPSD